MGRRREGQGTVWVDIVDSVGVEVEKDSKPAEAVGKGR